MNDGSAPSLERRLMTGSAGLAVAVGAIAALVMVQQLTRLGGADLLGETLTNAAHIPLFATQAVLLMRVLGYPSWRVLLLACAAVGAATEALQLLTARNASLWDLGLDLLGALPVIGAIEASRRLRRAGRGRWAVASVWAGAVLVVTLMTAAAPLRVLLAYQTRDQVFPVLLVPGAWQLGPLLASESEMRVVPAPADWPAHAGRPVLEVVWSDRRYPGITLSEVVPSWDGFARLAVDVYLPDGPPMPLTAAVGHAGLPGTAAHLRRTVLPGPQRLLYDLGPLIETADGEPARITRLILHTRQPHAGRRLLIGAVALVPAGAQGAAIAGNLALSP